MIPNDTVNYSTDSYDTLKDSNYIKIQLKLSSYSIQFVSSNLYMNRSFPPWESH